jgi:hypothetical protein
MEQMSWSMVVVLSLYSESSISEDVFSEKTWYLDNLEELMSRRGATLAERFQVAVELEHVAQQAALEDQDEARTEAYAAREGLLDDLEAFGESIQVLEVTRSADQLRLARGERFLKLIYIGTGGNVGLEFSGSGEDHHRLYREEDLNDKWVWFSRRGGREDRTVLFDSGLEELMVEALGLPAPAEPGHLIEEATESPAAGDDTNHRTL